MTKDTKPSKYKSPAMIAYMLLLSGLLTFGIFSIAGAVFAYIKRKEANAAGEEMYADHFQWIINTFWIALPLALINLILIPLGIGLITASVTYLWVFYRGMYGAKSLTDLHSPYNHRRELNA
ncbi:DUF4870 family protein [Enterovibrio nigricans]|uniref:Uncharacterized membrane protein n=1 Tax=Enterovibrio nigricans DSM 22720 TaxID=1121868 RepID=A0A1T4UZZ0_9GAMM|nr:hypothetical protein [Enterovibrio nigricans]PKF49333.1 hypothetical protein AT251_19675 [Enterovibrio nigricans]SKA58224.1 Uncharacterized membrane protein [Enterovibrio nigricans DSM 22720]